MNDDRNYILDRLKSRSISIDEFNFDNLKAPPLSMFLTPGDIQELNSIATSLRLSAKPQERYRLIDEVMRRRGLVKFLSGTNRVTYRHPEFPDILFKVASDAVGISDNPAEFYNQHLLKPFVTKIFEVSPGGVVAITERVNPITSREEFLSVADDIFELITEWLIGEYVLADFGSKFFMNYGIRKGFGCVLLDYPYLYKLDGNKLYCNKPDYSSPTGKCEGTIDYDSGYNFLHCTKCGATYKAKELEQKIKDNEIINLDEGENKMEIIIKGGSKDLKERKIRTMDTDANFAETIMSTSQLGEKMEGAIQKAVSEAAERTIVNTSNIGGSEYKFEVRTNKRTNSPVPVEEPKQEDKKEVKSDANKINTSTPKKDSKKDSKKKDKTGAPVSPIVTEEPISPVIKADEELTVNGVNPKAGIAESPISISEETKKEFENIEPDREPSPVETIERAINNITRCMNKIEIDVVKDDIMERLFIAVASMLPNNNKSLHLLISAARDIIDADIEEDEIDDHTIMDMEVILASVGKTIIDDSDCEASEDGPDRITELQNSIDKLSGYNEELNVAVGKLTAENQDLQQKYDKASELVECLERKYNEASKNLIDTEDDLAAVRSERDSIQEDLENVTAERDQLIEDKAQLANQVEVLESEKAAAAEAEITGPKFTNDDIIGIKTFEAVTVDIQELLPTQEESHNIVVLVDEDGKYAAIDKLMIAIDEVDGISIDEAEFVSKEYIADLLAVAENHMSTEESETAENNSGDEDSDVTAEDVSDEVSTDSNIAIATQQFLEEEEKLEV